MIAEKKIDVSKSVSDRSAKLIHFFISGASSGLGLSLYSALSKKNFLITVLGRCAPINLRGKDIFLFVDLSSETKFKYKINVFMNTSHAHALIYSSKCLKIPCVFRYYFVRPLLKGYRI